MAPLEMGLAGVEDRMQEDGFSIFHVSSCSGISSHLIWKYGTQQKLLSNPWKATRRTHSFKHSRDLYKQRE